MSEPPVTQAALDRLEENMKALVSALDRRVEQRFIDSEKAVAAALNAAKEAVAKQDASSEKRFEGVNEFRATLADQQRTLMPRSESDLRMNAAEGRIFTLEKTKSKDEGANKGGREVWGYLIGAIGIALAVLSALRR